MDLIPYLGLFEATAAHTILLFFSAMRSSWRTVLAKLCGDSTAAAGDPSSDTRPFLGRKW